MFDFHVHVTLCGPGSSGAEGLLPVEAMRLARCAGYKAVGLLLRTDLSALDSLLPPLVRLVKNYSLYTEIEAFAGVELVHLPPPLLPDAVAEVRDKGAALVLVHGETIPRNPAETVETGTNFAAIRAGADILAHPGLITEEDAALAAEKGVLLELSASPRHALANGHIALAAKRHSCRLVLNSDAGTASDFFFPQASQTLRRAVAAGAGLNAAEYESLNATAALLVQKLLRRVQ